MKPFENSFKENKIKDLAFSNKVNGNVEFLIISFWFPLLEVKMYNCILEKEIRTMCDIFYVANKIVNKFPYRNKKSLKALKAIKDGINTLGGNFYYLGTEGSEKILRNSR